MTSFQWNNSTKNPSNPIAVTQRTGCYTLSVGSHPEQLFQQEHISWSVFHLDKAFKVRLAPTKFSLLSLSFLED